MRNLLYTLCICLFCAHLQAQDTKTEVETRIKAHEVPAESKDWLARAFPRLGKAKWYKEVTSGKTSYEAKFKHNGSRYSVEFAESGEVEDVEKKTSMQELPQYLQAQLYLGFSRFEKFKLVKLQEQWTAATADELMQAVQQNDASLIRVRYEAEFKAEIEGKQGLWEGLFSPTGELISKRKIVLRPTDNLDY